MELAIYTKIRLAMASGPAEEIVALLDSVLPRPRNNSLFLDRAVDVLERIVPALVELRDGQSLPLDIKTIRKSVGGLLEILELAQHPALSAPTREPLRAYLEWHGIDLSESAAYLGNRDPKTGRSSAAAKSLPPNIVKMYAYTAHFCHRYLPTPEDIAGPLENQPPGLL